MSDPQAALNASRVADIPIVTIVRVMSALKAVGYAVVELPELAPNREGIAAWSHRLVEVTGRRGGIYVSPVGIKTMDGPPIFLPIEDARSCAAALLAAADIAEAAATEPDPHAGQLWANELQSRQRQVPSDRKWS